MSAIVPLAPPESGALTVYVGGRGYGESQVVVFPTGKVMVVDSFRDSSGHIPLDLLDAFGLSSIDLLVVTHADLDHCAGVKQLIDEKKPERIWRFPAGSMTELLARAIAEDHPESDKLARLRESLDALDDAIEEHTAFYVDLNSASWGEEDWTVDCIAPCATDVLAASRQMTKLLNWTGDRVELSKQVSNYLLGPGANPSERNNTVSLALSVRWQDRKLLLCGDVESRHANRGWEGILVELERDQRIDLVEAPQVIKVAHHGSRAAYNRDAWARHCMRDPPIAITTAYQRGRIAGRPPQQALLSLISEQASALGATASPVAGEWDRFQHAGWNRLEPAAGHDDLEHWVGVALHADGQVQLQGSPGAHWFSPL